MAIKLIANYSKRLGLPGYSSHQFSISVETELSTTDDVAGEAERLYQNLQSSVDEQIQATGFVPGSTYGMDQPQGNGANGNVVPMHQDNRSNDRWNCSDKQRDLIVKIVDEHHLEKNSIEQLAQQRFGKGVRQLNKLEASALIDELLEAHGGKQQQGRGSRNGTYARGRRGS